MQKYWLPILLWMLAVPLWTATIFSFQTAHKFVTEGSTTSGTVVQLEFSADTDSSNSGVYYPVVVFKADGEDLMARSKTGSNPSRFHTGQIVEILYEKGNPKHWCINDWCELYFLASLFGTFATLMTLAAAAVSFVKWRQLR